MWVKELHLLNGFSVRRCFKPPDFGEEPLDNDPDDLTTLLIGIGYCASNFWPMTHTHTQQQQQKEDDDQ